MTSNWDGNVIISPAGGVQSKFRPTGTVVAIPVNPDSTPGPVTIGGGIVVGASTALPPNVVVTPGSKVTIRGSNGFSPELIVASLKGGTIDLDNGILRLRTQVAFDLSSTITGRGSLIKDGPGVLTFSGSAQFDGQIQVAQGTLSVGKVSSGQGRRSLEVDGGAVLNLNGDFPASELVEGNGISHSPLSDGFSGTARINLQGHTLTIDTGSQGDNLDNAYASLISGPGRIVQIGSGSLNYDSPLNFDGTYDVQSGMLNLNTGFVASTTFVMPADVIVEAGARLNVRNDSTIGSLAGAGTIQLDAELTIGNSHSTEFTGTILGQSNLRLQGTGAITLGADTSSWPGDVVLTSATNSRFPFRPSGTVTVTPSKPDQTPKAVVISGGITVGISTALPPRLIVNPGTKVSIQGDMTVLDLFSTGLSVTLGSGTPQVGDQFVILSSSGPAFFRGQFTGLPDGATLDAGGATFRINYSLSSDGDPSHSVAVTLTRIASSTTTSLVVTPNPAIPGQPIVLTAVVSRVGAASGAPSGTVFFAYGSTVTSVPLDASGRARFTIPALPLGNYTVVATYPGTANDLTSRSTATTLSVKLDASTTVVSASTINAVAGQKVVLSAKISETSGRRPTGSVEFYEGMARFGLASIDANGLAQLPSRVFTLGTHAITVKYLGDGVATTSQGALTLAVSQASTTTTLTTVPASSPPNRPVTYVATIQTIAPGKTTPTGKAILLDGSKLVAEANVDGTGRVTFPPIILGLGTHSLSVRYSGDLLDRSSTSTLKPIVVRQGRATDYDGDGKSDLAVYLPTLGAFAYRPSAGGGDKVVPFGSAGTGNTIPAPGDYDGDGKADLAVYLPTIGSFAYRPSAGGADKVVRFGITGYGKTVPAPGDYDGDGKSDLAVYLPTFGAFAYRPSAGGADKVVPFGIAGSGNTIPAPGDYDGDSRSDLAVYLPTIGAFAYRPSAGGGDKVVPFGITGYGKTIPVPGDFDGSGRTEYAVYLPSLGAFAYRPANGGLDRVIPFGSPGLDQTLPAPGDYSGSGRDELGVYLPSIGSFAYRPAGGGLDVVKPFGISGTGQSIPMTTVPRLQIPGGPRVSAASIPAASHTTGSVGILDFASGSPKKKSRTPGSFPVSSPSSDS